jgi:SAM-dependent MidA family methyltransferase
MTVRGLQIPEPSAAANAASLALQQLICTEILQNGELLAPRNELSNAAAAPVRAISFARYMELALYSPGLGYYSGGASKLGQDGDFTTAPEITPLFGQTLFHVCAALDSARTNADAPANADNADNADADKQAGLRILEFGAGSGKLAYDLLCEARQCGIEVAQYAILELSGSLRARQQAMLHEFDQVCWLDHLPDAFSGIVLANEVLDAMPVHLVCKQADGWHEMMVSSSAASLGAASIDPDPRSDASPRFTWHQRPVSSELQATIERQIPAHEQLQIGYTTEVHPLAAAFVRSLAACLQGPAAVLLIDYGFAAHEYYLDQRHRGTLHCHYRHHAHDDPFYLPGLQDITAHVDFSDIAREAEHAGLDVLRYSSHAAFLLDGGITELLLRTDPGDAAQYLPKANAVQRLLSPAEMGELFKVLILGKNCDLPGPLARHNRQTRL